MRNTSNVIITGSSSGIGLAAAKLFSSHGHAVFGLDIEKPKQTFKNFFHFHCDVTNSKEIKNIVDEIAKKQKTIDALVNNAGVHFSANIENTSDEDFTRVLNINFAGCFFAIRSVLPYMKNQKQSSIVLVGSEQALVGKKNSAIYGATKGAMAQLTKSTALDYAKYNIRVNCVCPGTIDTPLYRNAIEKYSKKSGVDLTTIEAEEASLQPLGRIGKPEEVADLIYFLASEKAKFITGAAYTIDGGYTAK